MEQEILRGACICLCVLMYEERDGARVGLFFVQKRVNFGERETCIHTLPLHYHPWGNLFSVLFYFVPGIVAFTLGVFFFFFFFFFVLFSQF